MRDTVRFVRPVDEPALTGRADRLRQDVTLLALVQPGLAAPAKIGIFQPVKHEEGPLDPADFLEGEVDLVLAFVSGQFAQHCRWRDVPRLQRGDEAQDLGPMFADRVGLHALAEKRPDCRIGCHGAEGCQTPVGKIPQARAEAESQHRAEREHMVGRATRIGIMFADPER